VIAFFVVLGTGARIGAARSARLMRTRVQTIPPCSQTTPREYLLLLYAEAYPVTRDGAAAAVIRAARMRNIHALVAAPATNVPTIIVLVGALLRERRARVHHANHRRTDAPLKLGH
jgi:hypothetical protein